MGSALERPVGAARLGKVSALGPRERILIFGLGKDSVWASRKEYHVLSERGYTIVWSMQQHNVARSAAHTHCSTQGDEPSWEMKRTKTFSHRSFSYTQPTDLIEFLNQMREEQTQYPRQKPLQFKKRTPI